MPTPTPRPSITTDLQTRYANQKVGGSQDAKRAGTSTIEQSINAKLYDVNSNFIVKEQQGVTNLKGVTDGGTYDEISKLAKGISTKKYKS